MRYGRRRILEISLVVAVCLAMLLTVVPTTAQAAKVPLDPLTIPKYQNTLTQMPPVFVPTKAKDPQTGLMTDYYTIIATEFQQQILPAGFPKTTVWGYGGLAKDPVSGQFLGFVRASPGPSIVATRDVPINVAYVNGIYTKYMFAVDPTLDWTNPNNLPTPQPPINAPPFPPGYAQAQYPVTIATHFHGGEIDTEFDGGPFNWVSWNGLHGPDYHTWARTLPNAQIMHYPMQQEGGGLLWIHDHAMGLTRSNVYSGLAMGLLNIDPQDQVFPLLPFGKYWMPLIVQDRNFWSDGSLSFPNDVVGINPDQHPYWIPEFFGNTIMVNGKVWPKMPVDHGQYYFSFLEGSNARWYNMTFRIGATDSTTILPMTVVAKDGHYLKSAVTVDSLRMAPGERWSVLVDFTAVTPGTSVFCTNNELDLPPGGTPADPNTVGQIMRFDVGPTPGFVPNTLPTLLNPTLAGPYPTLTNATVYRNITLKEIQGAGGPLMVTIDGQPYLNDISELPILGSTEVWRIIDATADNHPMHIHGQSFQLVSWQAFDIVNYSADWLALNGPLPIPQGTPTKNLNLNNYLIGTATNATPLYQQWMDTMQVESGIVTTFIIRFAPTDGTAFPYNPTDGTTYYVWHCHIIDHEDQDMIRPFHVLPPV